MIKDTQHPGHCLADELNEINITATESAHAIHLSPNTVCELIQGNTDLTADMALRLGCFFGTGPELWLQLQNGYALYQAKKSLGDTLHSIKPWQSPQEM